MLSIIPIARAQSSGFPACSATELAFVLELRSEYDALLDSLSVDNNSIDPAIAYSTAQIEWRDNLWTSLPPCAEAIDAAVLMSQISSDLGAMVALRHMGISPSLNRYKDRLYFEGNQRDRLNARLEEIAALIESGERPAEPAPGERQLARCAGEEIQSLQDVLRTNEDLIASAMEIRSSGALLDYIAEKLDWRDQVWENLPPCAEAVEVGQLMSQVANDSAAALAFRYADVPKDKNPFDGIWQDGLNRLGDWLGIMLEKTGVKIEIAAGEAPALDLQRCSKIAIAELFVRLYDFNAVIETAFAVQNFGDYLDYAAAQIEWRNQLFSQMLLCAEAVESNMLVANLASDFSALFALSFAGIDAEENPYWDEVESSMPAAHETLVTFPSYAEDAVEKPVIVDSLPSCTAAERGEMSATVEDDRYVFAHLANEIATKEDLLSFSELQRRWRDLALSELPPCQEAIQTGLLLIQLTGDMVPMAALQLFTDLPVVQNPYWDEIRVAREAIGAIIEDFEGE
ncbi:MAG: hypothetical protein OXG78_08680 [Chloroflexi bacterium]|nr:hypothetical protein [Chloroflexota bacterium]